MVWAMAVETKRFGYCVELTVRFQKPLRPGEEVLASGELVSNRRNKVFETKGEIKNAAGEILATATGKYLPVKAANMVDFSSELIGDTGEFR
jgi:acyl-coenzyme A thioesterase PaaI-like protein